jgi:plasmid maintenance system antidote protein VapI
MKLKRGIQKQIRERTGFGASYVSDVCNGNIRITSWPTAKKFAAATGTHPLLWLEGTICDIQTAISLPKREAA